MSETLYKLRISHRIKLAYWCDILPFRQSPTTLVSQKNGKNEKPENGPASGDINIKLHGGEVPDQECLHTGGRDRSLLSLPLHNNLHRNRVNSRRPRK